MATESHPHAFLMPSLSKSSTPPFRPESTLCLEESEASISEKQHLLRWKKVGRLERGNVSAASLLHNTVHIFREKSVKSVTAAREVRAEIHGTSSHLNAEQHGRSTRITNRTTGTAQITRRRLSIDGAAHATMLPLWNHFHKELPVFQVSGGKDSLSPLSRH